MSDDAPDPGPDAAGPPEEPLPPVTPPSAGFIVQLFLVPAVIVMAIVGVWAMFGRIAATQRDWDDVVTELRSNNKHRRDRAMLALAQMIEADRLLGEEGEGLSVDPTVARALVTVFEERLAGVQEDDTVRTPDGSDDSRVNSASRREAERLRSQSTTAKALGLFDAVDVVAPALIAGMEDEHDQEVRKDSVNSISVIASRAEEEGADDRLESLVATPGLVDRLVEVSGEADPVMRDSATFALGLLPSDESRDRLEVLAEHGSRETRVNAAIGLARQRSTAGLPVFESVLVEAVAIPAADDATTPAPSRSNLLLITLLAATFTALIMAAANRGTVRNAGVALSVVLLIGAGVVAANTARDESAPETAAERDDRRERQLDHILALHAVQNTLRATAQLADELSVEQRERLVALVEPIESTHPEARIRLDASVALDRLRTAGEAP